MRFFVGTFTRWGGVGIALCEVKGGRLHTLWTYSKVADPNYLILSRDESVLYAVSAARTDGTDGGSAVSFRIRPDGLELNSRQDAHSGDPCHLCLSPDERFLYTANYGGGGLTAFSVENGVIGPIIQTMDYSTPAVRAHLHHVSFIAGKKLLNAVDLGGNSVYTLRQDEESGRLTQAGRLVFDPGVGPRHLVYGKKDYAYVVHELKSKISAVLRQRDSYVCLQTLTTLPEGYDGKSYCAAIRITPDGKRVLASNRGHDSLASFIIREDGLLEPEEMIDAHGQYPRDFLPLPGDRILVANQNGGGVALIGKRGGKWILADALSDMKGTVCICPLKG